jgi:predicted phosphodiesterase
MFLLLYNIELLKKMVNIQIVSDLHLEFRGYNFKKLIKPSAPILCLLGDICVCGTNDDWEIYKAFIKYISPQFKYILHIPGNHEYYTNNSTVITIPEIDSKIRQFSKTVNNLYFLNNNTVRVVVGKKSYVFIGTTLWTYVSPNNRKYVESMMNDYNSIYFPNEKPKTATEKLSWTPFRRYKVDDMTKLHSKSFKFINKELKKTKSNETVVILTHHKPYRSKPLSDILSQAYETDLFPKLIKPQPNLKVIAYGHTHVRDNKVINGVRIISNPKGYINQQTKFNDTFTIDI